jgi:hypothetical protein
MRGKAGDWGGINYLPRTAAILAETQVDKGLKIPHPVRQINCAMHWPETSQARTQILQHAKQAAPLDVLVSLLTWVLAGWSIVGSH